LRLPAIPTAEPAEGAVEFERTAAQPAETGEAAMTGAATGAETVDRPDTVTGDEHAAAFAQPVEPAGASGETTPAPEPPRRRRKSGGAAAPKAKPATAARKPRARTTTPRKRKDTGTA
jgi:hypothetical protein